MEDQTIRGKNGAKPKLHIVGNFIRQKRQALNLSQRDLGQLFTPAVTTQFISNVERGVTPLPHSHVGTLARVLNVREEELMGVLEREYVAKLSGRLGKEEVEGYGRKPVMTLADDFDFMNQFYSAYVTASAEAKKSIRAKCAELVVNQDGSQSGSGSPT